MGQRLRAFDALLAAAALLVAVLLLGPLLTIPLPIPLSYNEGWNAYLDQRAVFPGTGPLYPPAGDTAFNNYPPLSFYVVGGLSRFIAGDMIEAGRSIALASLLASSALLGWCVALLGGTRRGALAASTLVLVFAASFFRDYVAMDDPQWLAHALMLAGLAVLLRTGPSERSPSQAVAAPSIAAAALLMTAGGFAKHSLVGLPLAVTLWLALAQPRAALIWLAAATVWVSLGLASTAALHGQVAFADILGHHRLLRLDRMRKAVERLAPLLPMLLIAILARPKPWRSDPPTLFAALFVLISLATGIPQRLGEGVYYNAHFEALLALCLATGLAISHPKPRGALSNPALLLGAALLPVLLMLPWQLRRAAADITQRAARVALWQPVIARLAAAPGAVGCESLSLCFWAHKPFAVDVFNLDQSIETNGRNARLDDLARRHTLALFEYTGDSFTPTAAIPQDPVLTALRANAYVPVGTGPDGIIFLAPNPS